MATETEKATLRKKLAAYEGCVEHMYLDTKGYVTVGVGHLLSKVSDAQTLPFVSQKDNKAASKESIKTEYETIKKKTKGLLSSSYKKHTTLKLKQTDIDKLTNKYIDSFESELKKVYGAEEFASYPSEVRLALFDMIFNLGMTNLRKKFPTFNTHIKAKDWSKAAEESKRSDVGDTRNKYVKELLEKAAANAAKKSDSTPAGKSLP